MAYIPSVADLKRSAGLKVKEDEEAAPTFPVFCYRFRSHSRAENDYPGGACMWCNTPADIQEKHKA